MEKWIWLTAEVRSAEVWSAEVWSAEVWPAEVWSAEVWSAEVWSAEVRSAEVWHLPACMDWSSQKTLRPLSGPTRTLLC